MHGSAEMPDSFCLNLAEVFFSQEPWQLIYTESLWEHHLAHPHGCLCAWPNVPGRSGGSCFVFLDLETDLETNKDCTWNIQGRAWLCKQEP